MKLFLGHEYPVWALFWSCQPRSTIVIEKLEPTRMCSWGSGSFSGVS